MANAELHKNANFLDFRQIRKVADSHESSRVIPVKQSGQDRASSHLPSTRYGARKVIPYFTNTPLTRKLVEERVSGGATIKGGLFAMKTQTELANYTFYQQASQIKGVSVQIDGGSSWSERTIIVTIPDLFGLVADEVFELEIRTHQQYPQGRLDVLIKPSPVHSIEG